MKRPRNFVVKGLQNNLLGLPAIKALSFRDCKQFSYQRDLSNSLSQIFLKVWKHSPIPLCKKVEEELLRMQTTGIISPVDDPSPWCAGMVVVLKPSGAVRICVARKFTKLDANSEFWEISLAQASRLLTAFMFNTSWQTLF